MPRGCYSSKWCLNHTIARTARSYRPAAAGSLFFSGIRDEGLVYSIVTDIGVFNTGLNLNLCGMLDVLEREEIINDAVRTISLRFNTYNGQMEGLFSSVDITTKFTLGKVKGHPDPGLWVDENRRAEQHHFMYADRFRFLRHERQAAFQSKMETGAFALILDPYVYIYSKFPRGAFGFASSSTRGTQPLQKNVLKTHTYSCIRFHCCDLSSCFFTESL